MNLAATALLAIDLQNEYRPGAAWPVVGYDAVLANAADLQARAVTAPDLAPNQHGMGRELFRMFRTNAMPAEMGAGVL